MWAFLLGFLTVGVIMLVAAAAIWLIWLIINGLFSIIMSWISDDWD